MTIVRSLVVTALIALMSAHRATTQQRSTARPFEQAAVDAIEAYLRRTEDPKRQPFRLLRPDGKGTRQ
jgi:Tfp pilus assembly protein PilX